MRPVQYFSKDYLERCRTMKPEHVLRFLEDFRRLQRRPRPPRSKLISMKVPEEMLEAFKARAQSRGVAYQAQIKRLMSAWLAS